MTIRHLKIFRIVAETGSVTRAAQQLYLSQPSVSVAIRELEEHYGVRLFERLSHRIYITEAGRQLLNYAVHLVDLFDEMEQTMRDPGGVQLLRIGSSITVGTMLLPGLLRRIGEQYPQVSVRAKTASSEQIEEAVLKNELDLGLIEGMPHSEYIRAAEYGEDELTAICCAGHRFAQKEIPLEQFLTEPLLLREVGSGTRELFDHAVRLKGSDYIPVWESTSTQALVNGVAAGIGVSVLPQRLVEADIRLGRVAPLTVRGLELKRKIRLIYHRDKYLSEEMQQIISDCLMPERK